jgi:hypothetical protein
VVLSYRVGGEKTAIAGIRLLEQVEPGKLSEVHQERNALNSTSARIYRSTLKDPWTPAGPWLIALTVQFGSVDGWIDVGGVGLVMR